MRIGLLLTLLLVGAAGCKYTEKSRTIPADGFAAIHPETTGKPYLFALAREALNPSTSAERLHAIALQGESDPLLQEKMFGTEVELGENYHGNSVLYLVAAHPKVRPDTLEMLSRSRRETIISQVLKNPKTPRAVLEKFKPGENYYFDWGLAQNPKVPATVLLALAASTNSTTREHVAANPASPPEALRALSRDGEVEVRAAILKNPRTPLESVERMTHDLHPDIQLKAKRTLLSRKGGDHRLTDTESNN